MSDAYEIYCDCGLEAEWSQLNDGKQYFLCNGCFVFFDGDEWCGLNECIWILEESF